MDEPLMRNPVYQQLHDRLRALVGHEFHRGDQFLTEREVSTRFQVSRATANKALSSLVSEGFLEFRKGIGTFVQRDVLDYDLGRLVSFTQKARAKGRVPSTRVLEFAQVKAAAVTVDIRSALKVQPSDLLWNLTRLRLADEVPVILEYRYVVAARCQGLTRAQAEGSLYQVWTEAFGLRLGGADETIRVQAVGEPDADLLDVRTGSPIFEVSAVGFLEGGELLWWERTLYRGDAYEFRNRLGPVQSAAPAMGNLRDRGAP